MQNYKVNIDYEFNLFDPKYSEKKYDDLNAEWEYLYFFSQPKDGLLCSNRTFDEDYLKFIKSNFDGDAKTTNSKASKNFWGKLENKVLEQTLSNKLTAYKFLEQNDLFLKGTTISSNEAVILEILNKSSKTLVLKSPCSFSGRGFKKFYPDSKNKATTLKGFLSSFICPTPVIIEPLQERVLDIGAYVQKNQVLFHLNDVNETFHFQGSLIFKNFSDLIDILPPEFKSKLLEFETILEEIRVYYNKLWLCEDFGIDAYIYRDEETHQLKLFPLCEVNPRKTMGFIGHEIRRQLDHDVIQFEIIKNEKFVDFKSRAQHFSGKIPASPLENKFLTLVSPLKDPSHISSVLAAHFIKRVGDLP